MVGDFAFRYECLSTPAPPTARTAGYTDRSTNSTADSRS